jgi:hypothetical protein
MEEEEKVNRSEGRYNQVPNELQRCSPFTPRGTFPTKWLHTVFEQSNRTRTRELNSSAAKLDLQVDNLNIMSRNVYIRSLLAVEDSFLL